jgi:hypothetical protein
MRVSSVNPRLLRSTFSVFLSLVLSGRPTGWAYCRNIAGAGKRRVMEGRR